MASMISGQITHLSAAPGPLLPVHILGGLLYSEVCLMSGMAGILAWRFPAPGLFCFFLLLWLDLPRRRFFQRPVGHLLALALSFFCFWAYAGFREVNPPPVPEWLERAAAGYDRAEKAGEDGLAQATRRPAAIEVTARIAETTPLPGKRLRIVLTDILPADSRAADILDKGEDTDGPASAYSGGHAYSGGVVWTWNDYDPCEWALLPGQHLKISLRLMSLRSFANPGLWTPEFYWRDRGVFFRALSSRKELPITYIPAGEGKEEISDTATIFLAEKRRYLHQKFLSFLPQEGRAAGILPALVFGDRSLLDPSLMDLFSRSTLTHSLALSGLHLGFAVLAGSCLAWILGRLLPSIWLRIARPGLALLLSLPLAAAYLWLGQSPVSLQRAACMLLFWALLFFLKRPRALQDGLFAALACILAFNPFAFFDIGLQLSALCIATLAVCLPRIMKLSVRFFPAPEVPCQSALRYLARKALRGAFAIFCTSLCIQIVLLPLILRTFGSSGLLFPLNVLWLPLLGVFVLPGAFAGMLFACLGFEKIASLVLHAVSLPCEGLVALLQWLDNAGLLLSPVLPRPHWISSLGYWLLILALPAFALSVHSSLSGRRKRRAGIKSADGRHASREGMDCKKEAGAAQTCRLYGAGIPLLQLLTGLCLLCIPPAMVVWENSRTAVKLRLLDVGQGQSVLVEWSGLGGSTPGGRVLIDGGGLGSEFFDVGKGVVSPILTENRLPRLQAVVNSHPDRDHLEGLLYILEHFRVGRYFGNGDLPSSGLAKREARVLARSGLRMERLVAGDVLELTQGLHLEVLWPEKTDADVEGESTWPNDKKSGGKEDRNDNSLVLRLVWQGKGLAVIPGDAGKKPLRILGKKKGPGLSAQVLILPHHGSGKSLIPSFYSKVAPDIALASCGITQAWRYPARSIRQFLLEKGIELYSTAERGQISLLWESPGTVPTMSFALLDNRAD